MDEEDEKKKKNKIKSLGSTIYNIVRMIKYLANPVAFWALIIILIILLLAGFISYFASLPSLILGKVNKWLKTLGKISNTGVITANEAEIKDLCTYLEEMGYDVESYGFVEEITRDGKKTYDDEKFDGNPSRGTITSVKSKYLEAYIISEKKIYAISNPAHLISYEINADNYRDDIIKIGVEEIIYSTKYGDFIKAFLNEKNEGRSDDEKYTIENLENGIASVYGKCNMTGQGGFFSYIEDLFQIGVQVIFGGNEDEELAKDFFSKLRQEGDYQNFCNELESTIIGLQQKFSEYKFVGDGLIVLENNIGKYSPQFLIWLFKEEKHMHEVSIDEDNKLFIVKTPLSGNASILDAFGISSLASYAYDLNNWTTKYGKSQEFLIAVHTATMAPEFVYKLASSPAVDTKVNVSLFDTNFTLTIVPEDKSDESVLAMFTSAESDSNVLNTIVEKIEEKVNSITGEGEIGSTFNGIEQSYYYSNFKQPISNYYNGISDIKPFSSLPERVDGQDYSDYYIRSRALAQYKKYVMNNVRNSATSLSTLISNEYAKMLHIEEESISSIGVTDEKYSLISGIPFGEYAEIEKGIEGLQTPTMVSTPYITKVVKHWYRNQYFTNVGGDTEYYLRQRVKELLYNYYNILNDKNLSNQGTDENQTYSGVTDFLEAEYDRIDNMSEESLKQYVSNLEGQELPADLTDSQKKEIENEFSAMQTQFDNKDFTGGAYKIQANPDPDWKSLSEIEGDSGGALSEGLSLSDAAKEFILSLYVKEQRDADIVQIHNPLFEDNSQYIRNWLREKYEIYEGKTETTGQTKTETTNTNTDSDQQEETKTKVSKTERYIQGKTALQAIEVELQECQDVRSDMMYMLRDLKELFQDFEFDLENIETPVSKVLTNIMPAYKPYTPWPSVYEKAEGNSTKMIYKGGSTYLVAPENCIIRNVENGVIDMEFKGDTKESAGIMQMTLRVKAETGSLSATVSKGQEVKKGDKIANVTPGGGIITLKLNLFTATKQIARVEDFMEVKNKEYNDLSSNEKLMLYRLIDTEVEKKNDPITYAQGISLVNVVLNRIASPYCSESSISGVLGNEEHAKELGFINYYKNFNKNLDLNNMEKTKYYKSCIINVIKYGRDYTKADTLLGATSYFASEEDEHYYDGLDNRDDLLAKRDKLKTKYTIGKRIYGLSKEEYYAYLEYIVKKKLYEVIYELDISKYIEGMEEADGGYDTSKQIFDHQAEILKIFESAINEIISYYEAGTFIDECGGIKFKDPDTTVASLVKSNVYQEIEDPESQTTKVIDHFTLTANANYIVKWTFTYEVGAEGKITSTSVKVDREPVKNI